MVVHVSFSDAIEHVPWKDLVALNVNTKCSRYGQIGRVHGVHFDRYDLEFAYNPFSAKVDRFRGNFCNWYHTNCPRCANVSPDFPLLNRVRPIILFNRFAPEFGDRQGLDDLMDAIAHLDFEVYKKHNISRTAFSIFSDYKTLYGESLSGIESDEFVFALHRGKSKMFNIAN